MQKATRRSPEVTNLNVKVLHHLGNLASRRGLSVHGERRCLGRRTEVAADRDVALADLALELDLDIALRRPLLDEHVQLVSAAEDLEKKESQHAQGAGGRRMRYTRRPVQPERDGTGYTTLSCPVGSDDHVEIRPRAELDIVIRDEVLELYTDDRPGDSSTHHDARSPG